MSASGMLRVARWKPAVLIDWSSCHRSIVTGTPSWATQTSVACIRKSSYGKKAKPSRPQPAPQEFWITKPCGV